MFGQAAKEGQSPANLRRSALGVVYVAEQWCRCAAMSPAGEACVRIVTQAGGTGAAAGYVDPTAARDAIEKAIRAVDVGKAVGRLTVLLKQKSTPPIFKDRLLASGRRVWGVRHGFDDVGKLSGAPARRGPTFIDPDCDANRELLHEILALPDAD